MMKRRRKNPAEVEQYEILSSSTLKGIVLLGGVLMAAVVALRLYEKERSRDVASVPGIVRIPVQLPKNVVKKPS